MIATITMTDNAVKWIRLDLGTSEMTDLSPLNLEPKTSLLFVEKSFKVSDTFEDATCLPAKQRLISQRSFY
jgi:hypothetical protein